MDVKVTEKKDAFIIFDHVSKLYNDDVALTLALDDASFEINEGELVIFLGHSGAGKSTALNILGGMDTASKGRVIVDDKEITNYSLTGLTNYRRSDVGFIFQFYNLIPNLTIKENIELSTDLVNNPIDANLALEKVDLVDKLRNYPSQLSGGQQQRVAVARAIAKKPKILLCDEPTGALDIKSGKEILNLIQNYCRKSHVTTIIITHNQDITPIADKIICFNSGKVTNIIINDNPLDVEDLQW